VLGQAQVLTITFVSTNASGEAVAAAQEAKSDEGKLTAFCFVLAAVARASSVSSSIERGRISARFPCRCEWRLSQSH